MKPLALQYVDGELCFQGRTTPISQLLNNYHRPLYVYDLKWLKSRVETFKKSLPGVRIHYAMKANNNLKVLKTLKNLGLHVDVVSAGEIKRALEGGFAPEDVIFSGVGKTKSELRFALESGIYQINVESLPELERLAQIAKQSGVTAPVSLRLNPDIDIGTHPYIATGLRENKFGLELSALDQATQIFKKNKDSLKPVGLSFHLGSQMTDPSSIRKAFRDLKPIFENLRSQFPTFRRFDFGGGVGIHYQEKLGSDESILKTYSEIIQSEMQGFDAEFQCEPGRFLVAHAGIYIVQVQYIKTTTHKNFVIVDGGMNHLIRPSLYQAYHEVYPLKLEEGRARMTYDIVGPICESSDFLAKDRTLQELKPDEFVALADAGAYGAVMSSTYNLHELPLEVVLE